MFFKSKLARLPDEELMKKIAQGSEAAFTELYVRYRYSVMRYFTRMLWGNKALAEDFLHDLFLKIIHNPQQFDTNRNFSTWIYSVANNMCKNEYRRSQKKVGMDGVEVRHAPDPDHVLDIKAAQDKLLMLLETLDEEDKSIFLLRYEETLTIGQISEVVFMPEGTVKSRLFHLRKRLATGLSEFKLVLKENSL